MDFFSVPTLMSLGAHPLFAMYVQCRIEWRKTDKQPFRIIAKDRPFFGFAGLWDTWSNRETGEKVSSCTIITSKPNTMMSAVHDRMPVILSREGEVIWLDPSIEDTDVVTSVLNPYPNELTQMYPVHKMVGNVRNDVPECAEPWA